MSRTRGLRIRTRLTLQYAVVFALSGGVLLFLLYQFMRFDTFVVVSEADLDPALRSLAPDGADLGVTQTMIEGKPGSAEQEMASFYTDQTMQSLLQWSIVALVAMTAVSFVLGWFVAGRVLRPIHRVTETARGFDGDDLGARINLTGPRDEVRELSDTLDAMLDRIEDAFESERRLVANVSHELRTPVANQRVMLEVLAADEDADSDELRKALDVALAQNHRVSAIIDAMLLLSRSGQELPTEPVDLTDIVHDVVDRHGPATGADGPTVDVSAEQAVLIGHPVLLDRMVENLVDNACRYNVPDGWVRVELTKSEPTPSEPEPSASGGVDLTVTNSGPEVSTEAIADLLRPFRRGEQERLGGTGVGLGLPIVEAIATAHHGTLTVIPRPGGGLIAQVTLPGTDSVGQGDSVAQDGSADQDESAIDDHTDIGFGDD